MTQPDRAPWGPTLVSEYEREFMTDDRMRRAREDYRHAVEHGEQPPPTADELTTEAELGPNVPVARLYGTRAEHVAAVKQRALAELDGGGNTTSALASTQQDLMGHPETADHPAIMLGMQLAMSGHLDTDAKMREWIDGIR